LRRRGRRVENYGQGDTGQTQVPNRQKLFGPQTFPQLPQFSSSWARFLQPSGQHVSALMSQQSPAQHSPVSKGPEQLSPHWPQFAGSDRLSMQRPLQLRSPLRHRRRHSPSEQTSSLAHRLPHLPQFRGSCSRPRQCPSQQVLPSTQAWPHSPQCSSLALRSVHCPSQQVLPGGHSQRPEPPGPVPVPSPPTHCPSTQEVPRGQVRPQRPQCLGSVRPRTQRPEQTM
jgi:hypothetical protein